jgi:hypothetical protein
MVLAPSTPNKIEASYACNTRYKKVNDKERETPVWEI